MSTQPPPRSRPDQKPALAARQLSLAALLLAAPTLAQAPQRVPPGPLRFELRNQADDKPLPGVLLRLGGRSATSDAKGVAVFDGVPAGQAEVSVRREGFDVLRQTLVVRPGAREAVPLRLLPVALVDLPGSITAAPGGKPVASAHVSLRPIEVAAALPASFDLRSGYDGRFTILDVPVGRYDCRVEYAGFAPERREFVVGAQQPPLEVALQPTGEDVLLRVEVRGEGGRPLPGARLVAAEAWPFAVLGTTTTGADGRGELRLRRGRIDWMAEDRTCSLSRDQVHVRIEAAGHHTRYEIGTLSGGAPLRVEPTPTTAIEANEPNDQPGAALEVRLDAPVRWKVDRAGDLDWFRFRLVHPADVVIEVADKAPIHLLARLCDAQGRAMHERVCNPGQRLQLDAALGAGTYLVCAGHWGNNAASTEAANLTVRAAYAADPCEPNDGPLTGRSIQPGQEVRGYVHPPNDLDFHRFELQRAALVRCVVAPYALHPHVALVDEQGGVRAETVGNPGQAIEVRQQLPPGRYAVRFGRWGNGVSSIEPYSFRFEVLDDDGIDDPAPQPGNLRAVRTLAVDETVGNTTLPAGDVDRYAVTIPSAGVLSVRARAPFHPQARLCDARGRLLREVVGNPRQAIGFQVAFTAPQQVVLEVGHWGNGVSDNSPYVLGTFFEPADEVDAAVRDEQPADARPLRPGDTLRGTIVPAGDIDHARLEVDHPGHLRVRGSMAQIHPMVRLLDARGKLLHEALANPGQIVDMVLPVLPGDYLVQVRHWGDGAHAFQPYAFDVWLERADPRETVPLAASPVRPLRLDEAGACAIEHSGDADRFVVDVTEKGRYVLRRNLAVHPRTRLYDDRTGAFLGEHLGNPRTDNPVVIDAPGPARYRIEQFCWGDAASPEPGYVGLFRDSVGMAGERLLATLVPEEPTSVTFERAALGSLPLAARCEVDADGDGRADFELPAGERRAFRYAAEGLFRARAALSYPDGGRSESLCWVDAVGPSERVGVQLVVNHPGEGMQVERSEPARISAISWSGARIASVEARLDGRPLPALYRSPWQLELPLATLGGGVHELAVTARDERGAEAKVLRRFTVGDYLDLQPRDGATLSGDAVRVSWNGRGFGPAAVRCRPAGSEAWQEVRGQSARDRAVLVPDLEANRPYELQPLGGAEPGPIVTVTRIKGLAFTQRRFAANIRRDYDQRLGIAVRNLGEQPLPVRLECGKPPADSGVLVSFVGDGSEDRPLPLASGEEREFLLVLSAQDALQPEVRIPLRIVGGSGQCDEAEAVVAIALPRVALRWQDAGPLEDGIGRRLRLHNDGDGLTDVRVWSDGDLGLSPTVDHGLLPPGSVLDFEARPRLWPGFQSLTAKVDARALSTVQRHELKLALPEGKSIFAVSLVAGGGAGQPIAAGSALTQQDVMTARALSGAFLNPAYVDWSKKQSPQDQDGDGRPDRWTVDDRLEGVLWIGDDSDGDGEIDFVHADVGSDGQFDYSAFRGKDGGYEPTNLVDAHLEMGFSLPWGRDTYHPHDVDVVLGGKVIGQLRDTVPEGNYTFRLPPSALPFDGTGAAAGGAIELRTRHLRGGHYVVSSDFRVKARMTATQAYVAAASQAEAETLVRSTPDLVLEAPDYSVSSAELRVDGDRRIGAPLQFVLPVRNVGAGRTRGVAVALRQAAGGGVELARTYLEDVPLSGSAEARIVWAAAAGRHLLHLVVDPDGDCGDANAANNTAVLSLEIPGEDAPPAVQFVSPVADAVAADTVVEVALDASDDSAIARVELRIDGGLWSELDAGPPGRFGSRCLLQPGTHTLEARATDSGGRTATASVAMRVEAKAPAVQILAPTQGLVLHDARAVVKAQVPDDAAYVAARAGNGPWRQLRIAGGTAHGDVDVPFGRQEIEVMATDPRGARGTAKVTVDCAAQPEEPKPNEPGAGAPAGAGPGPGAGPGAGAGPATAPAGGTTAPGGMQIDGLPHDPTGPGNAVLQPKVGPTAPGAAGSASGAGPAGRGRGSAPASEAGEGSAPATGESASESPGESGLEPGSAPATDLQPEALPPVLPDPEPQPAEPANPAAQAPAAPAPALAAASGGARPPGAFVAAQSRTSDSYCTNRPDIGVKFRLPDWLRRKNLNYANKAEYERMVKKFLDDMKRRGIDTSRLEQFQQLLKKRIGRMDQPGELPGWLESIGLVGPKPSDPRELAAWRERMQQAADAWYLRLLSSGDPALIAAGLKARADAIGQFDQTMKEHAEAAIEQIHAHQKLIEDCVETLPVVGDVLDLYAAATGEAALSGDRLGALERALRAASVLGPLGLEQLLKRSPTAQLIAEGLGEMAQSMGKSGKDMLARALKMDPKAVDKGLDAFVDFLTKERRLLGESADDAAARAAKEFAKTPAGIADANRMLKDHEKARDLVNTLKKAEPGSEEMTRLCRELQSNKTAQALINRADVPDAVRKNVNDQIGGWYKAADKSTSESIGRLVKEPLDDVKLGKLADDLGISPADAQKFRRDMQALADKHGCCIEDLQVDTMTITNVRKPKPGDMQVSVGRDRDVTFVVKGPDGKVLSDIDHAISKGPYEQGFWKASGKGDLPTRPGGGIDHGAVGAHADHLDQCVTSKKHLEAYNTGEVQLGDFLDKSKTPPLTRIEDVKSTVAHKSEHWFEKAAHCGDPALASRHTAEGMRQATKQYDDLILARVRQYGLDPKVAVPAKLQTSMGIMKQVSAGKISPAKAEAMLGALGLSKEKVIKNMADYLEAVEKTAGAGFRRIKCAELVNQLARVPGPGTEAWSNASLQLINGALANGHVSGSQFLKLRADTLSGVVQKAKQAAGAGGDYRKALQQWSQAALQRRLISAAEKAALDRE
ncbi:MAG: hypothetical protein FJ265_03835 [Planctomycetes bacterium]|nr:hypothetical protein [Planctomycetota bacterium]